MYSRPASPVRGRAARGRRDGRAGGAPGLRARAFRRRRSRDLYVVADPIDEPTLLGLWADALAAAEYRGPPVWVHGDLPPANVLTSAERLSAVLDRGAAGVGHPACDLMPAWSILRAPSRASFRRALDADDASWRRGRGYAIVQAAVALPYYRGSYPGMVRDSMRIHTELTREASSAPAR